MGSGSIGGASYSALGTSGSFDGGYKGETTSHHTMSQNLGSTASKYPYNQQTGYFGERAGKSENRHLYGENPIQEAHSFYDSLAMGGIEEPIRGGTKTTMKDGSVISMRERSTSDGTPSLLININKSADSGGISSQKIHFEAKKKGGRS